MKKLLFTVAICAILFQAFAQLGISPRQDLGNLTIGPPNFDSIGGHASTDILKSLIFRVQNQTNNAYTIWWVKVDLNKPSTWGSAVCDTNLCYGDGVDSAKFTLAPNGSAPLYLYFYPFNSDGQGDVTLLVYTEGDRINGVNLQYKASAYFTGIDDKQEPFSVNVYPNPVMNELFVQSVGASDLNTIKIYNILGSQVKSFSFQQTLSTNRFDVRDLPPGRYFIKFLDSKESVISTRSFTKGL